MRKRWRGMLRGGRHLVANKTYDTDEFHRRHYVCEPCQLEPTHPCITDFELTFVPAVFLSHHPVKCQPLNLGRQRQR